MDRDRGRRRKGKNIVVEEQIRAERARARRGLTFMMVIVVALAGMLGGIYYYATSAPSHEGFQPTTPVDQVPPPQSQNPTVNDVAIPVSDITTNAKFYTYDSSGVTVRFFLAKGSDSKVHLAADACDVCYAEKKGYKQTDDVMTCNNCGNTFAINTIGTSNTAGGCWPSYIPMRTEGGSVLIQKTDLDGKRFMFA